MNCSVTAIFICNSGLLVGVSVIQADTVIVPQNSQNALVSLISFWEMKHQKNGIYRGVFSEIMIKKQYLLYPTADCVGMSRGKHGPSGRA